MAQKHNDVIHAALLEAAATLTSAYYASIPRGIPSGQRENGVFVDRATETVAVFTAMLEKAEHAYDAHLAKHNEK